MAIMTILMAMLAPAMKGFSETAGRRGAVTTVMNTLEQARVAALESGRNVTVVFLRGAFPDGDRLLVVREPEAGTQYEQLSKWIKLPKGVVFFRPTMGGSIFSDSGDNLPSGFDKNNLPVNLPTAASTPKVATLQFNPSGQVNYPNGNLLLHISEGVRDESGVVARIQNSAERLSLPFEIISLSKYTGRAQLDVTELAAN